MTFIREKARNQLNLKTVSKQGTLHYVSIIPDWYGFVPIFISDRPSVSIRPDIFRYDFRKGEGFERY